MAEPDHVEPDPQDDHVADPAGNAQGAPAGAGGTQDPPPARDPLDREPVDLAAVLAELLQSGGALLRQLQHAYPGAVRDALADPLATLVSVAAELGVDWQGGVDDVVAYTRSRLSGEFAVDEFGFDPEFTERIVLPALRPLVRSWFRAEISGLENIPDEGPALLVSNHAGTLPLDGLVLHSLLHDEIGRHPRLLGGDLIFATPYAHDVARRIGVTHACPEDALRLLEEGHLVAVFPEGYKGLGKPYSERYRLQRFGRGGFVACAIQARVPIIPVSVVGSEEIYPLIAPLPEVASAVGWPYLPITPLFPWFGLLGLLPLPSRWSIRVGEPIATDELDVRAAADPMTVFEVTDQVRETIQDTLYAMLQERRSPFF
ncbi:acyltransferase [Auraticoccus sp. F435]|uniref:Acyltransferase n=1 Tax=Auraticoccus cholistanensis TaxID=2656650 RepID=A0A6A9UYK4_9ACTN|nr:lysophospholipid acyltransferase family protein [Auraticoccus cholistanensis]MVA77015.1 acyltransferase [Auraticoccus cholistanensis]